MSGSVKNMYSDVAKSQNFAIFVVREHCNYSSPKVHIDRFIRRCPCLTSTLRSCGVLAKHMGQRFLFCTPNILTLNFWQTMREHVKSSKAARGVVSAQHIFRVSIRTIGRWSDDYKSGAYLSDNYQASSKEEAIGMACEYVKSILPLHSIVASEIKCTLLNPAAL